MLTAISLGAGVQSTTLALMAAEGEVKPMPDFAIFADTGDEKRGTYRHIEWLGYVLPFPLVRARESPMTKAGFNEKALKLAREAMLVEWEELDHPTSLAGIALQLKLGSPHLNPGLPFSPFPFT